MSSNEFTHIVDGQRQWSEKGLKTLQSAMCLEDVFLRFNTLRVLLKESFKECGGSFKEKEDTESVCKWTIHTQGWLCHVVLKINQWENISLRVGNGVPPPRPEKDLFPLWAILRTNWETETYDQKNRF